MDEPPPYPPMLPTIGCLSVGAAFFLLCLLPLVLVDAMTSSLERLHLHPVVAMLAVVGIVVGSMVNVPVWRLERQQEQLVDLVAVFGLWGGAMPWLLPRLRRVRRDTLIAVNVGGCAVPLSLAVWEIVQVGRAGLWPFSAMLLAAAGNTAVCYRAARPVPAVGIAMPGFLSPLMAVSCTWLLLSPVDYDMVRAPVAFVAGVLGPLIGADLLHLRDVSRVPAGMLSIGGAGTFDGIVLSGVLAALLA